MGKLFIMALLLMIEKKEEIKYATLLILTFLNKVPIPMRDFSKKSLSTRNKEGIVGGCVGYLKKIFS